ncbi:hypothetical protein XocUg1_21780, partial [Xanthomonas oryzae pv. oryzicola]|uniref:hypothetical protein n=1 Tax=Xanthomonas oryzae TaxID=347 RepID=UPI002DEBBE44|nr:hypothetical protein [Xanthomonas oryzae pv. oryzicola]
MQMPVGAIRMHVNGRPPAAWDRALEQRIAWRSMPPPEWHESHAICLTALGNAAGTAFATPCGLSLHRQSPDRDRQPVEIVAPEKPSQTPNAMFAGHMMLEHVEGRARTTCNQARKKA